MAAKLSHTRISGSIPEGFLTHPKICAGLYRIKSRALSAASLWASLRECVGEAYDLFASQLVTTGIQLTDVVLQDGIPLLVFRSAIDYGFAPDFRRPLILRNPRLPAGSADRWRIGPDPYEDGDRLDIFDGREVAKGFEQFFRDQLSSRVAYWKAAAIEQEPQPQQATVDVGGLTAPTRVNIEAYLQRVMQETGTRATKHDLALVAGYTDTTDLMRLQRGETTSKKVLDAYAGALGLEPQKFLSTALRRRAAQPRRPQ